MTQRRRTLAAMAAGLAVSGGIAGSIIGCGTDATSVLVFIGTATGAIARPGGGGGGGGTTQPGGGTNPAGVCTLPENQRSIRIQIRNEAQVSSSFALTFVVSAGGAGFVCDAQVTRYTSFTPLPYVAQPLSGNVRVFGCDPVTLNAGNQMLAVTYTGTIPPRLATDQFTSAQAPLDGNTDIPLPELIVLGEQPSSSVFSCVGGNLCTQGGFRYGVGTIITALRTQGTLCNARVSNRPEWVLRDVRLADQTARPFEYVKGGRIIVTILDRVTSPFPEQNQVVWQVRDSADRLIHGEVR